MIQRSVSAKQTLEEAVEQARLQERARIGRQLHAGILQELTVTGFQLRALLDAVPAETKPMVSELASWLEMRQAELRQFVADLQGGGELHSDFTAIIEEAKADFSCVVTMTVAPLGAKVDPVFRMAVRNVLGELIRFIAVEMGARHAAAQLSLEQLPNLVITHDGSSTNIPLVDFDRLRRFIGASGGALRVGSPAGTKNIVVDWNA